MISRLGSYFGSTINRLIMAVFLAQVALSGAVLLYVDNASKLALENEQRTFAMQLHDSLLVQYRSGGLNRLAVEIEKRLQLSQNRDSVILLVLPNGRAVAGNLTPSNEINRIAESWVVRDLYRVGSTQSEPMGITTTMLPGGARLMTGHLLSAGQQLSRINQNAMITAIILAIPISLIIAFLLASMINGRLSKIASITKAIEHGEMTSRLPAGKNDGVFDQLSDGINQMLDRLEIVVSELRLMTDGLAHDLRSPVTRLKATIDQALAETSDQKAIDALEKISVESEQLLGMLSTALQISRAEAGIGKDRFQNVSIPRMLNDLSEIYGPLAEEQGVEISVQSPNILNAQIHRELVNQALGNLIENALKYSATADKIVLASRPIDEGVQLTVSDNGQGIPETQIETALKRFGRLDPSRHEQGSGLGLSLVEAVAKLHGGKLSLNQRDPGLSAEMFLNTSSNPPA